MDRPLTQSKLESGEVLLGVALLAALLARTWIWPMFSSLWIDEWALYLISSEGPARIDALARQYISDQRLISLAAWLGMQLAGANEFGMRLYSVLSGGFCLLSIYQLGRRWFDSRTALLSVLMFPCLLAVYQQAANARAYMLELAFFLSVLWSVELWLERRGWFWLLTGAIGSFLLAHVHMLQIVGLGLTGLRVMWTERPWSRWVWPMAILLPGFAEAARQILTKPLANLHYLPMPTPAGLLAAVVPQPAAGLVLLALAVVLGFRLGTWSWPRRGAALRYYLLAAWLLPPLLLFALSIGTGISVFVPRYYFTAFPAAAWLLGSILAGLEPFRWRAAAMIGITGASIGILTGFGGMPNPNHENWRDALATIRQMRADPAEPVLYYSGFLETDFPGWREFYEPGRMCAAGFRFYGFTGNVVGLPYSPRPERIAEIEPELEVLLAPHRRIWLLSRGGKGPMIDWLENYLTARGWKPRNLGGFESIRLDLLTREAPGQSPAPVSKPSDR